MEVDFYTLDRAVQDRFLPIRREPSASRRRLCGKRHAIVALRTGSFARSILVAFRPVGGAARVRAIWTVPIALAPIGPSRSRFAVAHRDFGRTACSAPSRSRHARATVPYEPGLYLFPAGVFDARSEPIRVFLHPDLKDVTVADGSLLRVTTAQGVRCSAFRIRSGAEQAKRAIARGSRAIRPGGARREPARASRCSIRSSTAGFRVPFSPKLRLARRSRLWATLAPVIAVIVGAGLGPMLWKARNVASERKLFARATAENDVAGYRAYLARGGPRAEVPDVYSATRRARARRFKWARWRRSRRSAQSTKVRRSPPRFKARSKLR